MKNLGRELYGWRTRRGSGESITSIGPCERVSLTGGGSGVRRLTGGVPGEREPSGYMGLLRNKS